MPQPAVAAHADQAPDVLRHFPTQIAFDPVAGLDNAQHGAEFFRRQVIRFLGRVDLGFGHDLLGSGQPDPVDVTQRVLNPFLTGNIDAQQPRHALSPSALSLLVARIGAQNAHDTFAAHNPAPLTDSLHRASNLHDLSPAGNNSLVYPYPPTKSNKKRLCCRLTP
jgi:hypothetical protein